MKNYTLPQTLTFDTVVEEKANILKFIETSNQNDISLDLSELKQCDSAGLALLFDLKKFCKIHGKALIIQAMPPDTENLAAFYGVQDLLKNS